MAMDCTVWPSSSASLFSSGGKAPTGTSFLSMLSIDLNLVLLMTSWEECVEEAQKRNKSSEREGEETQL